MDPPNLYPTVKALLDGFTDSGLWTDDNYQIIQKLSFVYGGLSNSKKYKLEILVKPVNSEHVNVKTTVPEP